jgi:hypothetical protein
MRAKSTTREPSRSPPTERHRTSTVRIRRYFINRCSRAGDDICRQRRVRATARCAIPDQSARDARRDTRAASVMRERDCAASAQSARPCLLLLRAKMRYGASAAPDDAVAREQTDGRHAR